MRIWGGQRRIRALIGAACMVLAGGALAGCGSGGAGAGAGSATSTASSSTTSPASPASPPTTTSAATPEPTATGGTPVTSIPAGPSRTVTVTGRTVKPAPEAVDLAVGQTLTLTVTADRDNVLHAHGFELEQPVRAGVATTVELRSDEPGLYDVELHEPELRLFQVAVR